MDSYRVTPEQRRRERRARLLLLQARNKGYSGIERAVAEAMFDLNRHAREIGLRSVKNVIYSLKNHLIRIFYERELCEKVETHVQELECWDCGGTGSDGGDYCFACNGSGVYRTITLYCFFFRVTGQMYIWHQPSDKVDYPVRVQPTAERAFEAREKVEAYRLPAMSVIGKVALVEQYLLAQGVKITPSHLVIEDTTIESEAVL